MVKCVLCLSQNKFEDVSMCACCPKRASVVAQTSSMDCDALHQPSPLSTCCAMFEEICPPKPQLSGSTLPQRRTNRAIKCQETFHCHVRKMTEIQRPTCSSAHEHARTQLSGWPKRLETTSGAPHVQDQHPTRVFNAGTKPGKCANLRRSTPGSDQFKNTV